MARFLAATPTEGQDPREFAEQLAAKVAEHFGTEPSVPENTEEPAVDAESGPTDVPAEEEPPASQEETSPAEA